MMRLPNATEVNRIHERVAERIGGEFGVRDADLLRAVLFGARISRSGSEAHRASVFHRAAGVFHHVVTARPFKALNGATGLAIALLYLTRHGYDVTLAKGQAAALVNGARSGSMGSGRIASMFALSSTTGSATATSVGRD